MKRIALITGANKGLGLETAKQLAAGGIQVIIGARDLQKGESAVQELKSQGYDADHVKLEVSKPDDVKAVYEYIDAKYGKLDILINNAGIMQHEAPNGANSSAFVSSEILRETFEVNFFALVNLSQTLLPLLRKSSDAHIVNVSSILGSNTVQSDESSPWSGIKPFAYNASKAALNAFTVHLAAALKADNIKVNSAHPGWVKTDLGGQNAPLEVVEGAKTSVNLADADFTGKFIHLGEEIAW